jgi:TrmH family RNA methyltransferase
MISKLEIKDIKSLGQKKFRDEKKLFVVEGEKLVEEALRSGFDIVGHYRIEDIGETAMARISQLTHPSPALAVVRQPAPAPFDIQPDELVLALDGIRDPGNLGTILRIADWFGIHQILASEDTVEVYNPKVVQATMGAIFRVKINYCNLNRVIGDCVAAGGILGRELFSASGTKCQSSGAIPVYGTFLDGDNIYDMPLTKGGIIVMGSEANGISPEVAAAVTKRLYIPPFPANAHTSESLNVAVATAITCAEFRRR